jgi:hypothetical protein
LSGRRSLILTNKTKYVNGSINPNVFFNLKKWALIAMEPIRAGEELFSRYESVF